MKTSRSLAVGVIVLSLVLAAAVAAVLRDPADAGRDAAPEVAYTLLDGRQGTLQALRGKVVLVSFWSFGEVRQTPTAFLIDKRGRIVERYVGAPDFAVLQRLIESLLAEQA